MAVFKSLPKFVALGVVGILFLSAPEIAWATDVPTGSPVVLSVTASGMTPFSYQWQKGGANLSGATSDTYRIASMQAADAGNYTVKVSNNLGNTTSNTATLAAGPAAPAQVTTVIHNATQLVTAGHAVSFTAENAPDGGAWQVSTDGGTTWSALSAGGTYRNVGTNTLEITGATAAMNNNRYRYVTTSSTSNAAVLTVTPAYFQFPAGIATDSSGNLYVSDTATDTIQKISADRTVILLAGAAGQTGTADGSGSAARFNDPTGIATAADGTLGVADNANGTIRVVSTAGIVSTLAGSTSKRGSADGAGTLATFSSPLGIARDGSGNFFVADTLNNTVRRITANGTVSTPAGSAGAAGSADGTGAAARFNHPTGIAVDSAGNAYVSDSTNNTIRKITPAGVVSTLAGLPGVSGSQDGSGSGALFNNPGGLAVNGSGTLFVADTGNSTIRRITAAGAVTTVAGLPGIAGLMDGAGSFAWFNQPQGVAVDGSGNLFVADSGNAAIRKVAPNGTVTTIALSGGATVPESSGSEATPPSNPATTPTTPAASGGTSSSSGGGGGGGALDGWLVAGLGLAALLRLFVRRRRIFVPPS